MYYSCFLSIIYILSSWFLCLIIINSAAAEHWGVAALFHFELGGMPRSRRLCYGHDRNLFKSNFKKSHHWCVVVLVCIFAPLSRGSPFSHPPALLLCRFCGLSHSDWWSAHWALITSSVNEWCQISHVLLANSCSSENVHLVFLNYFLSVALFFWS